MIPTRFGSPVRARRVVLRMLSSDDIDDVHADRGREDVCQYLLVEARRREQVADQVTRYAVDGKDAR